MNGFVAINDDPSRNPAPSYANAWVLGVPPTAERKLEMPSMFKDAETKPYTWSGPLGLPIRYSGATAGTKEKVVS